jgi:hypothetical protein
MQQFPLETTRHPATPYTGPQHDLLRDFASRYIWWKSAQEAMLFPERILAQVMNLGTYADLGRLCTIFPVEALRQVVDHAEPGWFNERSWVFWQYRLGLVAGDTPLPPLPARTFPD